MANAIIQRIVFPHGFELPSPASVIEGLYLKKESVDEDGLWSPTSDNVPQVLGRTSISIPQGAVLSTDAYFNRVHAGYWQRWTTVGELTARISGKGRARMAVRRSLPDEQEVTLRVVEGELSDGLEYTVGLDSMAGGGCLWIDVEPVSDEVILEDGVWTADVADVDARADVAVCTYNRPEDVFALLTSLSSDPAAQDLVGRVWVIDNGSDQFTQLPGADLLVDRWGDRLKHIEQQNLGGSGGFARGLYEASHNADSPFVLLLDDDVVIEPEGMRRQILFGALARRPIAVGGQMLNRARPAVLHADAEWVQTQTLRYDAAPGGSADIELLEERQEKVVDAGYNAWWSCLIPTEAVRKIGLSMPFFIKYDDVEFGYRLARAGFRTVTLPSAAVWHEPWTLKDDTTDWTLYFHVRNRLIFASLMSAGLPAKVQKKRINAVVQDILKRDIIRNVLRRAYSSAVLAELGMRDYLRGPDVLDEPLQECVARVRQARLGFPDAATDVPSGGRADKPTTVHRDKGPRLPLGLPRSVLREYGIPVPKLLPLPPQLLPKKQSADAWRIWEMPDQDGDVAELPKVADHWWGLVDLPDAWVTTVDGGKVTRRTRTPALSRVLTRRAWELSQAVKEEFPRLAEEYAAAAPELTSIEAWSRQFGIEVPR